MELDLITINPNEGLGSLKFGMTRQEVKKLVGEPDEIEKSFYASDNGDAVDIWHYDKHDFSIIFNKDPKSKLEYIASSSHELVIWDSKLINKSFEEVLEFISQNKCGEYEIETFSEDGEDFTLLFFPNCEVNFWFDNNILTEIQWNIMFED